MKRKRDYEESSGNVFADLGFRNSKQELLKAKLTVEIYKLLKKRGVTQTEAAKLLGTTQAQVPYYGLTPGFTGLYQFNVVVPKVAANNATPITFMLGSVKSTQTLYIAVAN